MIINQRHCPYNQSFWIFNRCGDEAISYQVSNRLRAIRITLPGNRAIEPGKKARVNRDARSSQLTNADRR
jgi:hypothetical protein